MNTYSRALRHIDMKDVKQKHQQKIVEEKIKQQKIEEEKEYIQSVMKSEKYDWRKELNETMTSAGTFFTTLPATGDVDLSVINLDTSGFEASADVSFNSGTNSGFTGGFSSGNGIINLNGEGEYDTVAFSNTTDLSVFDSVNITAIAGNNFNGGMVPTRPLQVAFFTDTEISDPINVISPSTSSFTNVTINIPQQFRTKDVGIILYSNTSDGHGYHGRHFRSQTIPIPGLNYTTISNLFADDYAAANNLSFYLRDSKNSQSDFRNLGYFFWRNSMIKRYGLFDNVGTEERPDLVYRTWHPAPISGATNPNNVTNADYIYIGKTIYDLYKGTKLYGISNVSFRRKTPMNVFVPLNSPEATSFIRSEPNLSNLSPQERQQKLKEMLEASDEYVMKILGSDFPGTGARPADVTMPPSWETAQALPPGPSGYREPGTYDPKQFYNYSPPGVQPGQKPAGEFIPSPNLPMTGPGLSQADQDTQIAQLKPIKNPTTPGDLEWNKYIEDIKKGKDPTPSPIFPTKLPLA